MGLTNMTNLSEYGGWVERRSPTGGVKGYAKAASLACAGLIAAYSSIGTGGALAVDVLQQRLAKRAGVGIQALDASYVRSPEEDLARIREVFIPSVQDLATTFKVTRQSIYNWINGEVVAQENAAKLQDLAAAADLLAYSGVSINSRLLKRKFINGKSLFEVATAGESTTHAAKLLIEILKREDVQREKIKAKFALRDKSKNTADFDLPNHSDA